LSDSSRKRQVKVKISGFEVDQISVAVSVSAPEPGENSSFSEDLMGSTAVTFGFSQIL